jgi:hypothetical protein
VGSLLQRQRDSQKARPRTDRSRSRDPRT